MAFHTESHFGDIPFSEQKRDRLLARALDRPDRFALLIAAYDDRPVGFLYCSISDYVVGRDDLITTILSFYIGGEFRNSIIGARAAVRLLKGAVRWSEARAAREVLVHATAGIDVTRADRDAYIREHQLPFHPLVAEGYQSIGCTHCTVKGSGRSGRWAGKPKTECGLHL